MSNFVGQGAKLTGEFRSKSFKEIRYNTNILGEKIPRSKSANLRRFEFKLGPSFQSKGNIKHSTKDFSGGFLKLQQLEHREKAVLKAEEMV
jgi:hypothetical protein